MILPKNSIEVKDSEVKYYYGGDYNSSVIGGISAAGTAAINLITLWGGPIVVKHFASAITPLVASGAVASTLSFTLIGACVAAIGTGAYIGFKFLQQKYDNKDRANNITSYSVSITV